MSEGASARDLEAAAALLEAAGPVVFLTGAGVSAESGVPTFRGPDGLWKSHRAEDLATPEAFARDPRLVWEWYGWRRSLVARCAPNAGHAAIAELLRKRASARVITQNVDGLHERAARDAAAPAEPRARELPLELHGSLFRDRCSRCAYRAAALPPDGATPGALPCCPRCGALLRPDVVWFGEALDPARLDEAFALAARADVLIAAGTSAVVHPAASLPLETLRHGGAVVELNPESTPLTRHATVSLRGSACTLLPGLLGSR